MKPLNSDWRVTGRIHEIATRTTTSDKKVFNAKLAIDKSFWKDGERQERTQWIKLEAWEGNAERCKKVLKQGDLVSFSGEPKADHFEKTDKSIENVLIMVVDDFELRARAKNNGASDGGADEETEESAA